MMLQPPRRLARHVEPTLDGKRIDRVWAGISARRASRWSLPRLAVPAAVAGIALAAVLVVATRPHATISTAPLAGLVLESGARHTISLPDGSRAVLGSDSRLRLDRVEPTRVEATLERGEATFDVRHSETRTWTVHALGYDVVDRGTRFVVAVTDGGVSVHVESGSVEVIRAGTSAGGRTLESGESWSSGTLAMPPVEPAPSISASAVISAAPPPLTVPSAHAALSPRELLESADAARLAGHPREAAQAFDAIRTRFRGDPRAGLAAFELGRLRLDTLDDPAGAVAAFEDAVRLAPSAGFREDAEARRVEALDRMHDPRCPAARQAFLARYPSGLHAASVSARCP